MKRRISLVAALVLIFLGCYAVTFAFDSESTGTAGAFNPTANTEVQLPPDGKLNYTTVNIPAGVTVTFKKNAANTPVYMLATGDITIAGTINLNGSDGNTIMPGKGGPGGFDGGYGGIQSVPGGKGMGPGGGNPGSPTTSYVTYVQNGSGGGGGFGSDGANGRGSATFAPGGAGGSAYANANILPVIGGSGGGGGAGSASPAYLSTGGAGGGGGGAIVIASSTTITITGSITANGGKGANCDSSYISGSGGGGSGGAIKLIADRISGEGAITASGGAGGGYSNSVYGGPGGSGRVRFEANTVTRTAGTNPGYTYSFPSSVFVANIPSLVITSIGGINVPSNPTGAYATPDISLPSTTVNPVNISLSASNIPISTTVGIAVVSQYGNASTVNASLSGTDASSTASASVNLSNSYPNIITAQATFTLQTAMYYDGEKIDKVRVAATVGRDSETVYITESGREIKAAELMAKLTQ